MKCKHKWEMIDKTVLTHPIADCIRAGGNIKSIDDICAIADRIIYVFQCAICSEIKIEEK